MPSDSEGKKVPLYPLMNRAVRSERKHSPLNPYYVDGGHKRTSSGSLPPGLLRLSRTYEDDEDSDSGSPSLLLPSIGRQKVSYSESDSEAGSKAQWNTASPSSTMFIHATPPRIHRIRETDSDATSLNDLPRFRIRHLPDDDFKNRDLFHSTCSLPELPKWSQNLTDGYISEDIESKNKYCRRKGRHDKFKLSDLFSDLFLASENRIFHSIISTARQAKCFYWKKRKPDRWVRFKLFNKKLDRPFHSAKTNYRLSNIPDSFTLLNSPNCASTLNETTEEDYEAADDASVASSSVIFERSSHSFSTHNFGLNIADNQGLKLSKSRTSTNNSMMKRLFSDVESLHFEKLSFRESFVDAKNLCDSQLGAVHAEISVVLNDESDVSPGTLLIRKYLDEYSIEILKELSSFIEKILAFTCNELLRPNNIQVILEELQTIQSKLSEKRNGATGWFGIQTSMAISGVLNIIEHAQDYTRGGEESDCDSLHDRNSDFSQHLEWSLEDRILYRPSFGQLPNVNGIRQNEWTYEELQDVAEEGKLLNVVIVILRSGEIKYISPSVASVFGFYPEQIVGSDELPFLPPDTSGHRMFQTALQKLFEIENVFIEVLFKARRSDGLALLMEAKGIKLEGVDGSVWLARPVALLGNQWKDFGMEEQEIRMDNQTYSPEFSPKLSNCLVLNEWNDSMNSDLALCHICERTIPALLFEHHNIVCTNVHRAEMEIIVIQDSLESIRTQLLKQDEFLNEEVQMELLEKELEPDILREQKLYIESLRSLTKLSQKMMDKVDVLLALTDKEVHTAKSKVDNGDLESFDHIVDWEMPQQEEFFPSNDLHFSSDGMKIVKDQLSAMGNNLWTIACALKGSLPGLKIKLDFLRDSAHFFQVAFLQEENVKFEIGLKADTNSNAGEENVNEDKKNRSDDIDDHLRSKNGRISRIVVNTEKTLPVQVSDFPKSPMVDFMDFSKKSFINGSNPSILPRLEPSIKDYAIVKAISKGAYGSVYLARKKVTGDYFAIKVLKKADMIAKKQVTNVRAERMILTQLDSPYVVRLYYSFQSKHHLYLVMEYLNGGDCASLLKAMGVLDEKWARQYVSEMVLGLEFLHSKGVVHRDMKPDNLLIDSKGHIKITDFGLSRMGFISDRSLTSSGNTLQNDWSLPLFGSPEVEYSINSLSDVPVSERSPNSINLELKNKRAQLSHNSSTSSPISPFGQLLLPKTHHRRDSMASISSIKSFCSNTDISSPEDKEEVKIFLGTPDYVAPESIIGDYQDAPVDWWAVGVILYEFLYGYPPFNADTPSKVFENILNKNFDWHDGMLDMSPNARNLIESFLDTDPKTRLGSRGTEEIKSHPWFEGLVWQDLNLQEASFIPHPREVTDTEYFDDRGAKDQNFEDDDEVEDSAPNEVRNRKLPQVLKMDDISLLRDSKIAGRKDTDFGGFMYRNLPLLEKANQKLVQKLQSGFSGADKMKSRNLLKLRQNAASDIKLRKHVRNSSLRSSSRSGVDSESDTSEFNSGNSSNRRSRQASVPIRSRNASDAGKKSGISPYATFAITKSTKILTSPKLGSESRFLDILVADSSPGLLPEFLHKLHCRIIQVHSGSDAIALAVSDIKFDIIFLDSQLPIVSCNNVCRFIKTVSNINQISPIICITSSQHTYDQIQEFDDVLSKPISFDILKQVLTAIKSEPMSIRGFTF